MNWFQLCVLGFPFCSPLTKPFRGMTSTPPTPPDTIHLFVLKECDLKSEYFLTPLFPPSCSICREYSVEVITIFLPQVPCLPNSFDCSNITLLGKCSILIFPPLFIEETNVWKKAQSHLLFKGLQILGRAPQIPSLWHSFCSTLYFFWQQEKLFGPLSLLNFS